MIGRCIELLLDAGITEVIVVLNPLGDEVAQAVKGYPVSVVRTAAPEVEMAESVRTGTAALSAATTGVVVALCDHPLVSPESVKLLSAMHRKEPDTIVIPLHGGRKGHPTLFPRSLLDRLNEPLTLRDLVRNNPGLVRHAEVADPGVVLDMDTPEEYQAMIELCRTAG